MNNSTQTSDTSPKISETHFDPKDGIQGVRDLQEQKDDEKVHAQKSHFSHDPKDGIQGENV